MTRVPMETLEWLRVHFAPSNFHGRLQLGRRGNKRAGVLPLFTCERGDMMDFVAHLKVSPTADYYITANMVCGVKRKREDLFSLHNLVIDVDCHRDFANELAREELIERFYRATQFQLELPPPTSVVMTGRGVQLWWGLEPLHVKCKYYYDQVKAHYIKVLEQLISQEEFEGLTVDRTASGNGVGYFRLPGTYNSKVKKVVEVRFHPEKPIYVLQDLVALVQEESPKEVETLPTKTWTRSPSDALCQGKYSEQEVELLKGYQGFFRLKQLIQLRHLRDREIGEEERNNFNFMVYNVVCPSQGHQIALDKMRIFNEGFKQPMTERELLGTISSAAEKKGYAFTNVALIEFLQVTPEEQTLIGLHPRERQRTIGNPSKTASRTLRKEHRNHKIKELFAQKYSNKAIGELLGISQITVATVLKEEKRQQKQEFSSCLETLLKQNLPYAEIASTLQCSVSKVSRCAVVFA